MVTGPTPSHPELRKLVEATVAYFPALALLQAALGGLRLLETQMLVGGCLVSAALTTLAVWHVSTKG